MNNFIKQIHKLSHRRIRPTKVAKEAISVLLIVESGYIIHLYASLIVNSFGCFGFNHMQNRIPTPIWSFYVFGPLEITQTAGPICIILGWNYWLWLLLLSLDFSGSLQNWSLWETMIDYYLSIIIWNSMPKTGLVNDNTNLAVKCQNVNN